jgi:hypothetical protein
VNVDGTGTEQITFNETFDGFPMSRRTESASSSRQIATVASLEKRTFSSRSGRNEPPRHFGFYRSPVWLFAVEVIPRKRNPSFPM